MCQILENEKLTCLINSIFSAVDFSHSILYIESHAMLCHAIVIKV